MKSDAPSGIGRRQFLALGPALALWPVAGHAAEGEPAWSPVAVGYWLDSAVGEGRVVVPDRRLSPDPALLGKPARLSVRGLVPAAPDGRLRALELWAHFRVQDVEGPLTRRTGPEGPLTRRTGPEGPRSAPAHVWSYQAATVPQVSAPVSFRVPVDPEWGVVLSVSRTEAHGSPLLGRLAAAFGVAEAAARTRCRFTVEGGEESYRLRRGTYFLAGPRRATGQLPRWGSYRYAVTENGSGPRRLWHRSVGGLQPVDFDYLTIHVEPETQAVPTGPAPSSRV